MAKLGQAIVFINAEIGGLNKQLKAAEKAVKASMGNVLNLVNGLGKSMALVGGAVAGALGGMVIKATSLADELQNASEKTGLTTETLSALRFAADQTGGSISTIESAMKFMAKEIEGGGKKIKELGIDVAALKGQTPDQVFLTLARAVAQIKDPIERAATGTKLFGRGAQELMPILSQGAAGLDAYIKEAQRLGLIYTGDQIQRMDTFGDRIATIKLQLEKVAFTVAEALLPRLQAFADWLSTGGIPKIGEWIKAHDEAIVSIGRVALALAVGGPLLIAVNAAIQSVTTLVSVIGVAGMAAGVALVPTLVGLGLLLESFNNPSGFDNALTRWLDKIPKVKKALDDLSDSMFDFDKARQNALKVDPLANLNAPPKYSSVATGLGIPFFQHGGIMQHPGMALVGERGPELVRLPRGAEVIPNHKLGAGAVTITINAGATDPRAWTSADFLKIKHGITLAMKQAMA